MAEALTNVARYAQAPEARVEVRRDGDARRRASSTDDGVGGADLERRQRAARACRTASPRSTASLAIDSPPGAGTRLEAQDPLAGDAR